MQYPRLSGHAGAKWIKSHCTHDQTSFCGSVLVAADRAALLSELRCPFAIVPCPISGEGAGFGVGAVFIIPTLYIYKH